jgi:hypothetical protein
LYHDSLIRSDLTKIHKDRRKVIRISIVMNKIEVVSAVFLVSHKVEGVGVDVRGGMKFILFL